MESSIPSSQSIKSVSSLAMSPCKHAILSFDPCPHVTEVGYRRPKLQRSMPANPGRKRKRGPVLSQKTSPVSFPRPLILPGDDLSLESKDPPQSLSKWLRKEYRNKVTPERNVVYVAGSPTFSTDMQFMSLWSKPQRQTATKTGIPHPSTKDVVEYLRAFYHGMTVKVSADLRLSFTSWSDEDCQIPDSKTRMKPNTRKKPEAPYFVGLATLSECFRIRTRASSDGVFLRQLNLGDLLDAAISILPSDAYALLLLVDQDIFEDDDDVFTCGRAYGGSRVAVISPARYNPKLDHVQNVEREHAWPASHCKAYMETCCTVVVPQNSARRKKIVETGNTNSDIAASNPSSTLSKTNAAIGPIQAAVSAYTKSPSQDSPSSLSLLWLARICRTASHELGHCFGIGHCAYYACVMQSSASLAEDARQPMYLCPVDLAKVLRATGLDEQKRYLALLAFCNKEERRSSATFAAFAAWLRGRLMEIEGIRGSLS